MMTGKAAPQFNQVPAPYNTAQQHIILCNNHIIQRSHSTTQHNLSTIPRSTIMCLGITRREEIELATEVEDEKEEDLEEVED
jgi:hypothetical protein